MMSPTLLKYSELATKPSRKTYNERQGKTTRRMYIGWKHMLHPDVFSLMHPAKGGGQQVRDIPKDCNFTELHKLLLDMYFPDGQCKASNLDIIDLDASIVSYSGHPLPNTVEDKPFTVGLYCDSRKSNPIRIYLQTKKVTDFCFIS